MCHSGKQHFVGLILAGSSIPGFLGCQTNNGHCNIYWNVKWRNASIKNICIIIFIPTSICCVLFWTGMRVAEEWQPVSNSSIKGAKCCYNNSIWRCRTAIIVDLLNICCVLAITDDFHLEYHKMFPPLNVSFVHSISVTASLWSMPTTHWRCPSLERFTALLW